MKNKLQAVLFTLFDEVSSSKTRRYLVDRPDFQTRLDNVTATMEGLRTTYGKIISVNGEAYAVDEYNVPARLVHTLNSGRIYASIDAVGKCDPFRDEAGVTIPMTPMSFNAFWNDFNVNQTEEFKIPLVQMKREHLTLEDLSYLEDEKGDMRKFHESGICALEDSWLIGMQVQEIESYLPVYQAPSNNGVAKWLLSR